MYAVALGCLQAVALTADNSAELQGLVLAASFPVGFVGFYLVFGVTVLVMPSTDPTLWSGIFLSLGVACIGLTNGALFCLALRAGRALRGKAGQVQPH
jgi:hypothetical protein